MVSVILGLVPRIYERLNEPIVGCSTRFCRQILVTSPRMTARQLSLIVLFGAELLSARHATHPPDNRYPSLYRSMAECKDLERPLCVQSRSTTVARDSTSQEVSVHGFRHPRACPEDLRTPQRTRR